MYNSPVGTRGLVLGLKGSKPESFRKLFSRVAGSSPNVVVVEDLDIPAVGSAAVGFKLKVPGIVEGHLLIFATERIVAKVLVVGSPGRLAIQDTATLANLIDARIRSTMSVQ